jgi:hypothetical protein
MEVKNGVKLKLELIKHAVDRVVIAVKDSFILFLPNKVDNYGKRNPSHSRFQPIMK